MLLDLFHLHIEELIQVDKETEAQLHLFLAFFLFPIVLNDLILYWLVTDKEEAQID